MSFILDALRKSESERQRNALPGITYGPSARGSQQRSPWLPVAVALLLVNICVVAYMWYGNKLPGADSGSVASSVATGPASSEPQLAAVDKSPPAETKAASDPVLMGEPVAEPVAAPAPAAADKGPETTAAATPVVTSAKPPASSGDTSNLPTLAQLVLDGVLELPPLHMDVHVYNPAGRSFVSVNGDILRSGSVMSEGPVVVDVTRDGAVLRFRGTRFLLPKD
jgi:general secretion pathway protein B